MPTVAACEREIRDLHDLFVRWYCGTAEPGEFERLERALDESFELVSPDGAVSDRAAVLAWIRDARDSREGFDIEIRNVEPVFVDGERALVRYEEWQTTPTDEGGIEETGRLSTALFETVPDTTEDDPQRPVARWLYLQETWLDEPET